jgi:hypothetical protein
MSDPNDIVTVQVSTILAPFAATLQQKGCFVSFGATNQPTNSVSLLTRFSDLAPILSDPMEIDTAVWATGVVTVTTTNPLPASLGGIGATLEATLEGFTPDAYNGTFICTITAASEFTYPLVVDPGVTTVVGQVYLYEAIELNAMAATFFRQGSGRNVTVLELGYGSDFADQIAKLELWLTNNPLAFYGYFLPEEWGETVNIPAVLQLFNQFQNPEAMVYFWLTLSDPTAVGLIPPEAKCVVQLIEDPTVSPLRRQSVLGEYAEFSLAGAFYWALQFKPTSVTRVAPFCFKYVYGVTPYNILSAGPLFVSFKANNVNYIRTGAEGGINFTYIYMGVTADGFDYFNWWWTIDWVQINIKLDLANAIINGTNNPLAPLYYNQPGINQLEAVLAGTMKRGSGYGMVNGLVVQTGLNSDDLLTAINAGTYEGQCNVNAVPFLDYSEQNPSDYGIGEYDGLSTLFIPARGFVHVLVSVVATDIVTL